MIALLCVGLASAPQARPRQISKRKESVQPKAIAQTRVVVAPDRTRFVEVFADGRVRLDGHHVLNREGQLLGVPVWRRDSRALAFLQRSPHGLQLHVLPDLETVRPLVWTIPALVERQLHLFWIAAQRVGVGPAVLMPRVVVSWTTTTASAD
jgi:hypothetical protein